MFEQILNLITRGVVALETIAAHYQPAGAAVDPKANGTKTSRGKAKQEVEEPEDDEPEEKPAKPAARGKSTTSKVKTKTVAEDEEDEPAPKSKAKPTARGKKKAEPDTDELRDEIGQFAAIISGGDDDDASDEFADLLEDFEIKSVGKLDDEDVAEFHADLKEIVEKYFEVE